jgi:hypothetical protein
MDMTKLFCIHKFPDTWMEEYENRTGVLASLDSLDRVCAHKPNQIIMTSRQLAEFRKRMAAKYPQHAQAPVGTPTWYHNIQIVVKK